MNGFTILTVSQLNRYVKSILEENPRLREVYIKGEISGFTNHYKTGHIYMTIKDSGASVKAVMFSEYARRLAFTPLEGMSVILRAGVSLFERDGSYQIYVYEMQPDGLGAVWLAFQQLKDKLEKQGLFDSQFKKPIPKFPLRIGVITSETGAAYRDILNVLERRWPLATVVFSPATVQGDKAVPSLISSLNRLNKQGDCNVIIIGRGGGAVEDLWCFNDEQLAYAIFESRIPVVSAVGHETDFTICDFVADLRAPTPSAAAEIVSPDINDLRLNLYVLENKLKKSVIYSLDTDKIRIQNLKRNIMLKNPSILLTRNGQKLDFLIKLLTHNYSNILLKNEKILAAFAASLDRLNPVAVLSRGYTITLKDKMAVSSVQSLYPGDEVETVLKDGSVISKIIKIQKGDDLVEKTADI